jgi:hypothetical protein
MKSRLSRIGALTVAACLGLLGCEHWRNGLRKEADGATTSTSDPDLSVPASQHAPGGRSGLLSKEAKDIEQNLGYR